MLHCDIQCAVEVESGRLCSQNLGHEYHTKGHQEVPKVTLHASRCSSNEPALKQAFAVDKHASAQYALTRAANFAHCVGGEGTGKLLATIQRLGLGTVVVFFNPQLSFRLHGQGGWRPDHNGMTAWLPLP
jgi:hypothetical protein